MLVVKTIGRIRREHLVRGKSIGEIPRDLKVSRNAVRKVLRSGGPCFRMSARFSRVPRSDAGKRS
jgi:hypothetical protein